MSRKKVLIIGSGYAGACVARMLTDRGHEVHLFEKGDQPGGMARSFKLEGMTYEFGPHILANHHCTQAAIEFILRFIRVEPTKIATASFIDGQYLHYPPFLGDVERLADRDNIRAELANLSAAVDESNFESYLTSKLGRTLYQLFYGNFTRKFWQLDPQSLSAEWAKTRRLGEDLREKRQMFFNRTWCCYPKTDFNELFDNILRGIPVHCGVTIRHIDLESPALIDDQGNRICGDVVISTLSIDRLFRFRHGELEYSGYDIEPIVVDRDHFHPQDPDSGRNFGMVYYPDPSVPQCRITEYKSFNNKDGDEPYRGRTIITREVPNRRAKFYPLPDSHNEGVFSRYLETLAQNPRILSIGRMGLYKYTTIDTTTEQVFRFMSAVGEDFARWESLSPVERFRELHIIRGRHDN